MTDFAVVLRFQGVPSKEALDDLMWRMRQAGRDYENVAMPTYESSVALCDRCHWPEHGECGSSEPLTEPTLTVAFADQVERVLDTECAVCHRPISHHAPECANQGGVKRDG